MRLAICLLSVGCIPVLTSPGGADEPAVGADWEAPENSWPAAEFIPATIESEGWAEGDVVPDLRAMDQHGDEVSLWQFYGQVIAVDISTMWCAPCKILASEVDETWKDYESQGFMYLTLMPENNLAEAPSISDLNAWADAFEITAPVLSDADRVSDIIVGTDGYPRIMIIGRDLTVLEDQIVPAEDSAIRAAIESAL